jgi:dephospho-CoA kinase (EC 2.7.1.24)
MKGMGCKMKVIGLTGGIASGKSTVSNILREMGAYVIDADEISREIIKKGSEAWKEIIDYYGNDILLPDGEID